MTHMKESFSEYQRVFFPDVIPQRKENLLTLDIMDIKERARDMGYHLNEDELNSVFDMCVIDSSNSILDAYDELIVSCLRTFRTYNQEKE
jgi:hypothetical protein